MPDPDHKHDNTFILDLKNDSIVTNAKSVVVGAGEFFDPRPTRRFR